MEFHVRRARPTDAAPLARLAESTFRATFADMNSPENMEAYCAEAYGETVQGREIADQAYDTFVAEHEGELVGYGQLHWHPPGSDLDAQRPAEIKRLYVDAAWHGKGVAQALMAEVFAAAEAREADKVWLGVWEHNPRAIAFYRKIGFVEIGEHVFQLGDDPQRDLVMVHQP